MLRITALTAGLLLLPVTGVAAQDVVGHVPERSPFRDLEYKQEISLFGGYFVAGKDPAGAVPRSGAMAGLRYEANVGGPVSLFVRASYVRSERMVIDPREEEGTRELGIRSWPLYLVDAGIAVNLTGQKSYRRLVPALNVGFGFAFDANQRLEEDPFRFGTPFALTYGGSIRYVPGGRFQLRVAVDNYLYRLSYPEAYYLEPGTGPAVLEPSQKRNFWKNNTAFTLGGSLFLFR